MPKSDDDNIGLATSANAVDELNSGFYGDFPFPWPPMSFDGVTDPLFGGRMLSQELGDYSHRTFPEVGGRVWVGGCGTNQAIYTALRFPNAQVTGSDLSRSSLALCAKNAKNLGIENLTLKRESLNEVTYEQEFDYVICTGVIHHNSDPSQPLARLAAGLKPSGVMELMVYNKYHSIHNIAIQKAARLFVDAASETDFKAQLSVVRKLVKESAGKGSLAASPLSKLLKPMLNNHESDVADVAVQPVWRSYTVESFEDLCKGQGLSYLIPVVDQFDLAANRLRWNMEFDDAELQAIYDALPDSRRWQITNLLMLDNSPMLWFYLQRDDSNRKRLSESEICDLFLETTFTRAKAEKAIFVKDRDSVYQRSPKLIRFPGSPPAGTAHKDDAKRIYDSLDEKQPIVETFKRLNISTGFHKANRMRQLLATALNPYLQSVTSEAR